MQSAAKTYQVTVAGQLARAREAQTIAGEHVRDLEAEAERAARYTDAEAAEVMTAEERWRTRTAGADQRAESEARRLATAESDGRKAAWLADEVSP